MCAEKSYLEMAMRSADAAVNGLLMLAYKFTDCD